MKSIRWRIILVVVVILIALFKIYPTVNWATLEEQRRAELTERWEQQKEEKRLAIEFWRLPEEERNRETRELEELGKEVPQKPSLFRDMKDSLVKWWLGDAEQVLPLGLDLKGGIRVELEVEEQYIEQVMQKLLTRIDQFGVAEPDIRKLGATRISIELPGATDIGRVRKLIEEQAFMQWILVDEELMRVNPTDRLLKTYEAQVKELEAKYDGKVDEYGNPIRWTYAELDDQMHALGLIPDSVILRVMERRNPRTGKLDRTPLLLRSTPLNPQILTGDELEGNRIRSRLDERRQPVIDFTIRRDAEGRRKFQEATREYNQQKRPIRESLRESRGWRLAILVDNMVVSAPSIRTEITTPSGVITGMESMAAANDLVVKLRSGSLAVKPTITNIVQVGPRLGADSIRMGVRAALLGLALVVVFMIVYYLKSGVIAVFALCLNILIILAALSTLGATLTLPGIAGIILTIGMAVDANVLIFERIREEFASAKKVRAAISSGYDKAFRTILDANLTTLITAVILYRFGTGPIKGFAVTLSFGILASMFTALFVTRLVFEILLRMRSFEDLRMLRFFSQPSIDFAALAKKALIFSGVIIAIGIASVATNYDSMLGIDFSGGSELLLEFDGDVDVGRVREFVQNDLGYKDAQVRLTDQEGGRANKVSIQSKDEIEKGTDRKIEAELGVKLLDSNYTSVGPAYAVTMWKRAIVAMVLSLAGIIIYIWFRFEFVFGIAAVVALIHDVLITLGIFSGVFLFGPRQINLPIIAAILTIIGYSLNDTIVVFDRIREDLKIMKRLTFKGIINTSINQTLSRTVLTSLTTLLVVLALLILGGQAVGDFAFAMCCGVVAGTYSSIFIASPILLLFHKKRT
jgi:SecD/SecF fusion protein